MLPHFRTILFEMRAPDRGASSCSLALDAKKTRQKSCGTSPGFLLPQVDHRNLDFTLSRYARDGDLPSRLIVLDGVNDQVVKEHAQTVPSPLTQ